MNTFVGGVPPERVTRNLEVKGSHELSVYRVRVSFLGTLLLRTWGWV